MQAESKTEWMPIVASPFGPEGEPPKMTKPLQIVVAELLKIVKAECGKSAIRSDQFFIDWSLVDVKKLIAERPQVNLVVHSFHKMEHGDAGRFQYAAVRLNFLRGTTRDWFPFLVAWPDSSAPEPEPTGPALADIVKRQTDKAKLKADRAKERKRNTKTRTAERDGKGLF